MKKEWVWAAAGVVMTALTGLAVAFGWKSPGSQLHLIETTVAEHSKQIALNTTNIAVIDQKLDDLVSGMTEILGHRPRRNNK